MSQERVAWIDGEMLPESQVKVPFRDDGFVYGDAVFDTTRTFGGKIFKLNEHLDRLYNSLAYMRLDPGMSKERMAELTMQVLEANLPILGENDDYWVTQRVTRGVPEEGGQKPTVIIECKPLPFKARSRFYRDGLPMVTPSIMRTPPQSMSPRAKVNNYINLKLATMEVQAQDPDTLPLLLDVNGNICEGPGANFFIVKDGVVTTPKEQYILAGISRMVVMELAQELSIETHEADIDLYDAHTADEAFVTSTSFCICPVSTLNGSAIGAGSVPGPVTDQLTKAYSGLVGIDIAGQYLARLE